MATNAQSITAPNPVHPIKNPQPSETSNTNDPTKRLSGSSPSNPLRKKLKGNIFGPPVAPHHSLPHPIAKPEKEVWDEDPMELLIRNLEWAELEWREIEEDVEFMQKEVKKTEEAVKEEQEALRRWEDLLQRAKLRRDLSRRKCTGRRYYSNGRKCREAMSLLVNCWH